MHQLLALFLTTLGIFIEILKWMLLGRAIISWIPGLQDTKLGDFLYIVTEWVITPVRSVFEYFGGGKSMLPIDIPFILTYIFLSFIGMML